MIDIIDKIRDSNPTRDMQDISRRLNKLQEECGELSQAYLSVTSTHNKKNKNWRDVMEEAADVTILAVDIALTIPPSFKDSVTINKLVL